MTLHGSVPLSGDDSALPEDERAILDRARALIPRLAERAPAAAAARRLPDETIAEYREAGILRILQPRRFADLQGRFSLFSRIVEEFTFGCASSAWVYAVLAEHQWIIAQCPEPAQIDVWGDDPEAVASSSLAPRAAAKPVAGGWRLSGRYPFSRAGQRSASDIEAAAAERDANRRQRVGDQKAARSAQYRIFGMHLSARRRAGEKIADHHAAVLRDEESRNTSDLLQEIRRDVMTILTHHAASRQAAMVPYGHMLLHRSSA